MNLRPYWWDTVAAGDGVVSRESLVEGHQSGSPSSRTLPDRIDVLVVGAGYTGLSAAQQLAAAGASVLVVDREEIGWGASSRNGGQVLTGLRLDPATLVSRYGEPRARALFHAAKDAIGRLETLIAREEIDCGYERCGHIQAAWKPAHFDAFRHEQALLGRVFEHPVELIERSEQRSEVGSDLYHGLLLDSRSGALNPAQYVRGLARVARRRGVCILAGVGVEGLDRHGGRWRVRTSAGSVAADDVLFATNGYTDGAAPALQRRFVAVGSYIVATEPLTERQAGTLLPRRRMAFDSKHFLYYFRLTADRRLLFGGRAEFTPPDARATRRAADVLRRGMTDVFPEMAGVRIDYAWGGNVAFTRDQMPHAGQIDGVYFAGGYCGHGIALATELGALIARRMGGEASAHPLFEISCPAIPFHRGTSWLLPLVGAYFKVQDWIS